MPRVHLVQQRIHASNPQHARDDARSMIAGASVAPGDMVVLCELFSTGFRFDVADLIEQGPQDEAFAHELARKHSCVVIAGHAWRSENRELFNVVSVMNTSGLVSRYAKMHAFSPGREHTTFAQGAELGLFRWQAANLVVQPAICYDLRFPEQFRSGCEAGAQMIVIASAWPSVRVAHWRALAIARAIENQSLVAACNALGECPAPLAATDGSRPMVVHPGSSLVISHQGELLADGAGRVGVVSANVDTSAIAAWRQQFPVANDRKVVAIPASGLTLPVA